MELSDVPFGNLRGGESGMCGGETAPVVRRVLALSMDYLIRRVLAKLQLMRGLT